MASRALAIGATATTAAFTAYVASEEGARRSCVFWANAFPVYARYRAVQARHRDFARAGVPRWTGMVLSDDEANEAY